MQQSQSSYQSGTSGANPETVAHCAVCNRPIAHGQTYYYCRACGRGPLCNNHFYGDSGCAFCRAKKGFPGWAAALIVIAVLLIAGGAFLVVDPLGLIDGRGTPSYVAPTPTYYSLSTSVSPSGSGGISPSGDSYTSGTVVTLRATPSSGYVFDHWGGNASGSSSSTSVAMNSNKHVVAYFTTKPPPSTDTTPPTLLSLSESRAVTSVTISWTTDEPATSQVEYGQAYKQYDSVSALNESLRTSHAVTLSGLKPGTSYHYRIKSTDAAGNLAASGNKIFTTLTEIPPGYLTLTTQAVGHGRINGDTGSTSTHEPGTSVTLIASPSPGWTFCQWGGDATGTGSVMTISMNSEKRVIAYFELEPASVDFNGWYANGARVTTIAKGDTVTATVTLSGGDWGEYKMFIARMVSPGTLTHIVWSESFSYDGVSATKNVSFTPPYLIGESDTDTYYVRLDHYLSGTPLTGGAVETVWFRVIRLRIAPAGSALPEPSIMPYSGMAPLTWSVATRPLLPRSSVEPAACVTSDMPTAPAACSFIGCNMEHGHYASLRSTRLVCN